MKKYLKYLFLIPVAILIFVFSCNKKEETILKGTTSILVDETLLPIIEDQVAVFESIYDAKINLIPQSEKEGIVALSKKGNGTIILSRELSNDELSIFNKSKIVPRSTPFAIDAISFITNKKSNDTLLSLSTIVDFLNGKKSNIKGLVFDNPNSSTASYIAKLAGITALPENGVFSFKTNDEVIKYVSQNDGMIGVVGINWLVQPKMAMQQYVDKVNIMSVKANDTNGFVYPSQNNIATRKYPLARVLYSINCQGYEGLGMGFSSFIAGEKGQRIILKSGLAPMREPSRNIRTRKTI